MRLKAERLTDREYSKNYQYSPCILYIKWRRKRSIEALLLQPPSLPAPSFCFDFELREEENEYKRTLKMCSMTQNQVCASSSVFVLWRFRAVFPQAGIRPALNLLRMNPVTTFQIYFDQTKMVPYLKMMGTGPCTPKHATHSEFCFSPNDKRIRPM